MFYVAYRCRDCGKRALHLTSAPLLAASVAGVLAAVFVAGLILGKLRDPSFAPAEPVARPAPGAPTVAPADTQNAQVAPLTGDIAFTAAAEAGDANAQLRLGLTYLYGNGVERNSPLGLKWIEKAAEQGHAEAQYTLGNIHLTGRGALQSFPLAFKWFEKAAQQNHAEAQYSLGQMYRNGQGVAVDKTKAYIWFNLSAAQGHERARDARDGVLPSLSPEQVVAAQREALAWRPVTAEK